MHQWGKQILNKLEKSEKVWYICKPLFEYNYTGYESFCSVFLVIQGQRYVFC